MTFGAVVLVIASISQSCSEFKYRIWAVPATAQVVELKPSSIEDCRYVKFYVQDENGRFVSFFRTINMQQRSLSVGDVVDVEYIPRHASNARLIDERSLVWPAILLGIVLASAAWLGWVWWEFHSRLR